MRAMRSSRGISIARIEGVREAVDVVWVDDQRILQLLGRARQRAQHEHAVLVVARGDEFLGHQIHSIVQRADDAEVRESVECDQADNCQRRSMIDHRRRAAGHRVARVQRLDRLS